jgi:hypothetical protein
MISGGDDAQIDRQASAKKSQLLFFFGRRVSNAPCDPAAQTFAHPSTKSADNR